MDTSTACPHVRGEMICALSSVLHASLSNITMFKKGSSLKLILGDGVVK